MYLFWKKLTGSVFFIFLLQSLSYAQKGPEIYSAQFYKNWFDLFDQSNVLDSLQFSIKEKTGRYLLVDKILNPKSGKLRKKDFGGYAFRLDDNYYAQHMLYTEYLNDIPLLVRYHVLGMYGAVFVATDDPLIGLEQHNYTGLGIIGDAVAESVKNRKDRSNKVWKSEDGKTYSIIFFGSILNEDGKMELINIKPVLLSENGINYLASHFNMGSAYVDKVNWTAEEIGVFLTLINEAAGRSIVKFEGLNFFQLQSK